MQNIRLVASDLDGTLLLGDQTCPSGEMLALIKRLRVRDVMFVAASGRQYENMRELFGDLDIAYLCYNGGLCVYRGNAVYTRYLDHDLSLEIIRAVRERPGCRVMVSVHGAELIEPDDDFYAYMTGFVGAHTRVVDDVTAIREPIFKVALYDPRAQIDDGYWKARFSDRCEVVTSGNVWLDFVPKGLDKGVGLSALCAHFHIDTRDCLVFGDNENDRGMLEVAGHPVTMQTAHPAVINLGKYTTDTVENAIKKEFGFVADKGD